MKSLGKREGRNPPHLPHYSTGRFKMKFYDYIFMGLIIITIKLIPINKSMIEGIITGVVIGGYIGWRLWHDNR